MSVDYLKLAAALELAADALRGTDYAAPAPQPQAKPEPKPQAKPQPQPEPKPTGPTPKAASNVTTLNPATMYGAPPTSPSQEATTQQPSAPTPARTVTKDEVTDAATALWQKTGDQTIIPDLLARYGVTGISAMDPSQYPALLAEIQETLNAG